MFSLHDVNCVILYIRFSFVKKLPSNPLNFQPSKKSEGARKPTNRCRRCGKYSHGKYCDTQTTDGTKQYKQQDEPSTSKFFSKLPMKEAEERTVITLTTDSQITEVDEPTQGENTR